MKSLLKQGANLIFLMLVSPLVILYIAGKVVVDENSLFGTFSQLLSLVPGKTGGYLRKHFYRFAMERCETSCVISFATLFSQPDTEIGHGVYIGPQCNIGKSKIGDHCLFGSGVHILSGKRQHDFSDIDTPIQQQGGSYLSVEIGEDTWIGNNAVVMANIGKKCVIGAGSVVTNDVADYSVVAGNPAKVVKMRA